MKIGFVTDSTSDLPAELLEQHGIECVPSILVLEGRTYADGAGISRADFYTRLPSMATPPTTAAPSIGEFSQRYRDLFERGCEHIISIHAAGTLTTIVNSARMAAEEFPGRISVIDSGSLSLGIGFQVLTGVEAALRQTGLEATLAAISAARKRLCVRAALDTMDYVHRSGRVPYAIAAVGDILRLKPIIALAEGRLQPLGAARTTHQSNERMLEMLLECGPVEKLAILHTNAEERARWLLASFMDRAPHNAPREIHMLMVTTVIGTHVGPNGLGFAALSAAG